jgi:hypothetical protein
VTAAFRNACAIVIPARRNGASAIGCFRTIPE